MALSIGVIGHTGFVGSELLRSLPNAHGFNSKNVTDAEGARFNILYCAAAPGSMFQANKHPDRDAERIQALIASLKNMRAEQFVLISTIAVLERFDGGYTEADCVYQDIVPYGSNRRRLEEFCQAHFPRCLIVRLPALFGTGLAKNFIFDLLNPMPTMLTAATIEILRGGLPPPLRHLVSKIYNPDSKLGMEVIDRVALAAHPMRAALEVEAGGLGVNAVMFHNRKTTYQFYELACLANDIELAREAELYLLHLAPAPLQAAAIYSTLIGSEMPETNAPVHFEDMRTCRAALWGSEGPYQKDGVAVLTKLEAFFRQQRQVA